MAWPISRNSSPTSASANSTAANGRLAGSISERREQRAAPSSRSLVAAANSASEDNSAGPEAAICWIIDRKSVVEGKSVPVRVDLGGRRIIKKKTKQKMKE